MSTESCVLHSRIILFFLSLYLTAATRTPRIHIDHLRSRDRRTDFPTAKDPRQPQFPAANLYRFPRRTETSDSLSSGSV